MRIYLSGPMTNMPDWNYPAFHAAAERLRALGHTVYNPAHSTKDTERTPRAEFLRDDLALIAGFAIKEWEWDKGGTPKPKFHPPADAICLLPGWERSAGARMELHVALELGLTVFEDTLPNHVIVPVLPERIRLELLDAIVSAWAPKGIEVVDAPPSQVSALHQSRQIKDVVMARPEATISDTTGRRGTFTLHEVAEKVESVVESAAQEAHRLVHGNRGADYGHPIEDFTRTAALWTAQFRDLLKDGAAFTFREVWQAMICVKLSRERNKPKRDNRVDICGYAETGEMCEERDRQEEAA